MPESMKFTIAWQEKFAAGAPRINLWWSFLQHPTHPNSYSLCPISAAGGKRGYVYSRSDAEEAMPFVSGETRRDLERYLRDNLHLEGEVEITKWFNERPEWLD